MTKPVWSHVLALSGWILKKAHIVSCQETLTYKYLHASQIPHNKASPPKPYLTV